MTWWYDLSAMLLLICPAVALLTGLSAGCVSRNWGLGFLTGATTIVLPLLLFEVEPQILFYALVYAFIGLLGSIVGYRLAKFTRLTRYSWTKDRSDKPYERSSTP
jgi:hypothetical protein